MKNKIKNIMDIVMEFIMKYKRYCLGGVVFIVMMVLLFTAKQPSGEQKKTVDSTDPMSGIYQDYTVNEDPELEALINNYYSAAASGNTAIIESIATPISDEEISYISFYSQYIESYNDIQIFTKQGLDADSLIVSCIVNLKFVNIDTSAPGFDFFYVQKNEDGNLYINNLYGSFNQANGIYDMDGDVTTLIAAFIQQEDVLLKQAEVQQAYNEAVLSDENLNNFVTNTLKDAIVQWSIDYQAEVEAKAAEEAAAAQAEAEAKAAEEAAAAQAAQEAEEEANARTGRTTDKVNVRASADKNSEKIGTLDKGEGITVFAEEGDFYKVNFNGTRAYIVKSSITILDGDGNEEPQEETTASTVSIVAGTEITLSATTNIRSAMDSSSSKVAVAYAGEKVKVVQSYAEGWTKVKYGKKEGYIRTDLLTE